MPSIFDAALLADHVYDRELKPKIDLSGWRIRPVQDAQTQKAITSKEGFFESNSFGGALYRHDVTGEYVIAFHGLDGVDDLFLDVLPTNAGALSRQFLTALDFVEDAMATIAALDPFAEVSFVGHSLGGALAGIFAMREGKSATVFNPVPFISAAEVAIEEFTRADTGVTVPAVANPGNLDNVTNITVQGDIAAQFFGATTGGSNSQRLPGQIDFTLLDIAVNDDMAGRFGTPKADITGSPAGSLDVEASSFKATLHFMDTVTFLLSKPDPIDSTKYAFVELSKLVPRFIPQLVNESVVTEASNTKDDDTFLRKFVNEGSDHIDALYDDLSKLILDDANDLVNGSVAAADPLMNLALIQLALNFADRQIEVPGNPPPKSLFDQGTGHITADLTQFGVDIDTLSGVKILKGVEDGNLVDGVIHARFKQDAEFIAENVFGTALHTRVEGQDMQGNDRGNLDFDTVMVQSDSQNATYMLGTDRRDLAFGGDGDDMLLGADGDDILLAGEARDTVFGGDGDDIILGERGHDDLFGEDGDDHVFGGDGADKIVGGDGDDRLFGGAGSDVIYADIEGGSSGAPPFTTDFMNGGAGNDKLVGGVNSTGTFFFEYEEDPELGVITEIGVNLVVGSAGDLLVVDSIGASPQLSHARVEGQIKFLIKFDDDNLIVSTTDGFESVVGGGSSSVNRKFLKINGTEYSASQIRNDWTEVDPSVMDSIEMEYFGSETSHDKERNAVTSQQGTAGDDNLTSQDGDVDEEIRGGPGNDTIYPKGGNDKAFGEAGNDTLIAGSGNGDDLYDGGSGNDTIVYSSATLGVDVDLAAGTGTGVEVDNDTIVSVENVVGGSGADTIAGDGVANELSGADGNDTLTGRAGDDTIDGGAGEDVAVFSGNALDYTISTDAGTTTVTDNDAVAGGDDGVDTLTNVETLRFADRDVFLGANNAPFAVDDSASTDEDQVLSVPAGGLLANDIELDGGDTKTITAVNGVPANVGVQITLASGALLTVNADGSYDYDPNGAFNTLVAGDTTTDSFIYTVSDAAAASEDATVTLTIHGASAPRQVTAGTGAGETINGGDGNDILDGLGGDDTINGGIGTDTLDGGDGADIIDGGAHNDVIIGGAGDDTLTGGTGDDRFVIEGADAGIDTVSGGDGTDTVAGGDGDDVFGFSDFSGVNTVEVIDGGGGENRISGSGADDTIDLSATQTVNIARVDGLDGNDTIKGTAAADTIDGGAGNDSLEGNAGADLLVGNDGDDTLTGGADSDFLSGGAGDDTFIATTGDGDDIINGSIGTDTVDYSAITAAVTIDLDAGTAESADTGTDSLSGIENAIGGSGNDTITGDEADNQLDGAAGDDTLTGGAGNDTVTYAAATSTVTVDLAAGTASGTEIGSDTLATIENVIGGSGNDTITGDAEDNLLVGGAGNDALTGGAGTDTASYAEATASVTVDLGAGTASGTEVGSDTLATIENVVGGSGNDTLTGDGGDNVLTGGAGNDALTGGAGTDTASFAETTTGVQVDLAAGTATGTESGTDTLATIENVVGGAGDDTLTGDGAANELTGGAGDDTLDGGAGSDVARYAGAAADYSISTVAGVTTVTDLSINVEGHDGTDTLTNIETLRFADRDVFLDGTNNAPIGADDQATLNNDGVLSVPANGLLANDVEFDTANNLTVSAVNGLPGNVGVQIALVSGALLTANADGSYVYDPNGAFDTLGAGEFADDSFTYTVSDGAGGTDDVTVNLTVAGFEGSVVTGTTGNDTLPGTGGSDTLEGLAGDDTLDGGVGNDIAQYAGNAGDYSISTVAGTTTVTDLAPSADGDDGTDTLTNIEVIRFADRDILLDGSNNAPVAVDDTGALDNGTTLTVAAGGLLTNDVDFDAGNTITISAVNGAAIGVGAELPLLSGALLTVNADGSYTYNPNGAFDFLGTGRPGPTALPIELRTIMAQQTKRRSPSPLPDRRARRQWAPRTVTF